MPEPLSLNQLLEHLNYQPGEYYQHCTQPVGRPFRSDVRAYPAPQDVPQDVNVWFSVNPTQGPERTNQGRGGAADVTRLAGIWADLDVKAGGCPTMDAAMGIIEDLAGMVGTRPVAVTFSGHGVQPIWAIEDGDITDRPHAAATLRRWGQLVANVGARRDSRIDSLYDLPRVLRAPGSINWKNPQAPITVASYAEGGSPITMDRLLEVLEEYGIPHLEADGTDPGVIISPPAEWKTGPYNCTYADSMVKQWGTDTPGARHPWLVAQATRLAAAARNGCLTDTGRLEAEQALTDRFRHLTAGDREATTGEIRGALTWGVEAASTFTDQHLATELGNHAHTSTVMEVPEFMRTPGVYTLPPNPRAEAEGHAVSGPHPGDGELSADRSPVPDAGAGAVGPHSEAPTAPAQSLLHSEDGLALALIHNHGHEIRYQPERKRWLHWAGNRWEWQPDNGSAVWEMVRNIARTLEVTSKSTEALKRKALSSGGVAGVIRHATADPRIHVSIDALDSNPLVINTPGGLVELTTGKIRPAQPDDLVTRTTQVTPIPGPPPLLWQGFLNTTFNGDQHLIRYMRQLAGLALIGDTREQILPFWYGQGKNGKSTLIEALMYVLREGDYGYAKSAPTDLLMAKRFEGNSVDLANLAGARLVVCSELEDGQRLAEARVKQLTSSESITARFLYGQPFSFTPTFLTVLIGNHRPQATAGGFALWRRIRAIPFAHEVTAEQRDPNLREKLRDIGGHILQWAIDGAVDYLENGIQEPRAVTAATGAYQQDQDSVERFALEMLRPAGGATVTYRDMRSAYEAWCKELGEEPVSQKSFTTKMGSRAGITAGRNKHERFYEGVALTSDQTRSRPMDIIDLFGSN